MKNILVSLIHPKTKKEFFDNYRNNEPMVSHDLNETKSEILNLQFLKSLNELFSFWPKNVDYYLPGIADEVNSKSTTVDNARKMYEQGSGLIFNDADTESPILKKWVDELIMELGLSTLTYGRSLIYAIPAGKVTDPHFDQNINFVFQVKGQKKWWVAPNEHVNNPMTRHTIGTAQDAELASYSNEMPKSFPKKHATEYNLRPGSFLFVPRGAWHSTQASNEDTLSISFTFSPPTWIDFLTTALRGRLAQSGAWRETANFVNSKEHYDEAIENFEILLSSLAHDVPNWKAEDIIGAMEQHELHVPGQD